MTEPWSIVEKTVLITGGSSGIGRATAEVLCRAGARVRLTSRDLRRSQAAANEISQACTNRAEGMQLDLASTSSIRDFSERFLDENPELHVLIHNAGTFCNKRRETVDGFEAMLAVHHLGPFLLTKLLLPRLIESAPARIINVGSRLHRMARRGIDFEDLQLTHGYSARIAYARSKLALELFTRGLAERVAEDGITVNSIHPGAVKTHLRDDGGALVRFIYFLLGPTLLSPEQSAESLVRLVTDPSLQSTTGQYFSLSERKEPSAQARDMAAAERLWRVTETLLRQAGGHPSGEP